MFIKLPEFWLLKNLNLLDNGKRVVAEYTAFSARISNAFYSLFKGQKLSIIFKYKEIRSTLSDFTIVHHARLEAGIHCHGVITPQYSVN